MGREGPCSHCNIGTSRYWRPGPPEKPVLCNACGSSWAKGHQLDNYVPRHGNGTNYELKGLLSEGNPPFSESNPRIASSDVDQFRRNSKVQGKKRSSLGIQSRVQEEQFAETPYDYDDNLIYKQNWMTASNETLLGAVLLTPVKK